MDKSRCLFIRDEVPESETWNLKDLFENDELWFEEYEKLKTDIQEVLSYKGKMTDPQQLLNYLKWKDALSVRMDLLLQYASRKKDQDVSNSKYLDMKGKGLALRTDFCSLDSFFTPELMKIEDETLEDFYSKVPELQKYKRLLELYRIDKKHILSEAEENILAQMSTLNQNATEIASVLRNADLRYDSVTDGKGTVYDLTDGNYISLVRSTDRILREHAFKAYYKTYRDHIHTLASALDGQIRVLKTNAKIRKYSNTLEASLSPNEVPVSVYYNLIEASHKHISSMYKYMDLRKKALNLDTVHMYDLYTPIVKDYQKQVSYEEAKALILEALKPLGDDYLNVVKEALNNRWIDVYENVGKRGGAYSSGGYPHPYMLLNYDNTLDATFTLIHEMGHSLHSYLTMKTQDVAYQDYVIFVAEVASTVNEVLLVKYLLSKSTNDKERAYLINHFLEQFRTTFFRQCMFAEFELKINQLSENDQLLSSDILNKEYLELNKLYYGQNVFYDEEIETEWARIPHFFYNYYVFQYSTGFSCAVSLANRILTEGEKAVKDYLRFLSSGNSYDPISLLKIAGVDMSTPKPIDDALNLFDELVEELDQLL